MINNEVIEMYGSIGDDKSGVFLIPYQNYKLRVIASALDGWDHISVSLPNRVPNWYEMEHVAKLFLKSTEIAVQYHVPKENHINIHPNCLHWWRPHMPQIILMPPKTFV
jgi:hypothetical protein